MATGRADSEIKIKVTTEHDGRGADEANKTIDKTAAKANGAAGGFSRLGKAATGFRGVMEKVSAAMSGFGVLVFVNQIMAIVKAFKEAQKAHDDMVAAIGADNAAAGVARLKTAYEDLAKSIARTGDEVALLRVIETQRTLIADLSATVESLRGEKEEVARLLTEQIGKLRSQVEWLTRQLFGRKSEKTDPNQMWFDTLTIQEPSVAPEGAPALDADNPFTIVDFDGFGAVGTLIANIQAYLYQKNEWNPKQENSFAPALCNRIDRNTSGLVIAAKNAAALRDVDEMIRSGEVHKEYLCIVRGTPSPRSGRLENYLFKDSVQNKVYVRTRPVPGARKAITLYETISARSGLTLLRCVLVTGRTHQIRAQLAAAGHPLLGDGKYGITGRSGKEQHQALCSYRLRFGPGDHMGTLEYLSGKTFKVKDCDFVRQYFPETVAALFARED